MSEASLGTRTLRGTAWAYGSYVGGQAVVLVSTAVLARVLSPAEFGLVALALIFVTLLDTVSDLGLGPALVISTGAGAARTRQHRLRVHDRARACC